jgi:hypothetical protein
MPPVLPVRYKGPLEILDIPMDWLPGLPPAPLEPGEAISLATFTADSGITIVAQSFTTTNATVFLGGGELGASYDVVCEVVTTMGRTYYQTVIVKIIST